MALQLSNEVKLMLGHDGVAVDSRFSPISC